MQEQSPNIDHNHKSQKPSRYVLLDAIRGLAALWVMAFHFPFPTSLIPSDSWTANIIKAGHLGVPIFFVISGFCLSLSANKAIRERESASSFLRRRFIRIFPPFWFSMLITVLIPVAIECLSFLKNLTFNQPDFSTFPYSSWGLFDWLKTVTLVKVFDSDFTRLPAKFAALNAVYWSLAIEVQFYAIVALGLTRRFRLNSVLTITSLFSVPFACSKSAFGTGIFLPYWPAFTMGIILHHLLENEYTPRQILGKNTKIVGFGTSVLITYVITSTPLTEDAYAFNVYSAAFAILIWFSMERRDGFRDKAKIPALLSKPLFFLGKVSYSLYLTHVSFFVLASFVVGRFDLPPSIDTIAKLSFVILCSSAFYFVFESPFAKPMKKTTV